MLDEQLEHIVLVHYRDIKEGSKSSISHPPADPVTLACSSQTSSVPSSVKIESPISLFQTSVRSTANEVEQAGPASVCDDGHSENGPRALSHAWPIDTSITHSARLLGHEATGFADLMKDPLISWSSSLPSFYPGTGLSSCETIENSSRITFDMNDRELHVEAADPTNQNVQNFRDRLMTDVYIQPVTGISQAVNQVQKEHDLVSLHTQFHHHPVAATKNLVEQNFQDGGTDNDNPEKVESRELKKLDSFGRWMDKDIGEDCNNSLMASDSGNYLKSLDANDEDKEVSSLPDMHLDMESLSPYLSQEQLFSIIDFAPDWAYVGVRTKVLIVGTFLGSKNLSIEKTWGCMFGEIEVSAEVLAENVIQCQTPLHSPGRVPFYVTCSNRLACSEIREFEYLENPTKSVSHGGVEIKPKDEVRLEVRLLKLLDLGPESMYWKCSVPECENCKLKRTMYLTRDENENFEICESNHMSSRDVLFQRLVSDKLYGWLVFKIHEGGKGPNVLDIEGQGVIHLAAGLGYVWAMDPVVSAGISPNFRDAHGRTGLHWASYFGREETVIALVKLGAIPGLVDDPTSAYPRGQTAADLASSRGHKGIAGYLAEADLECQLSKLTVNENEMDNITTNLATDSAFESADTDSSNMTMDEKHYLRESLAAFRKSAYAAASIQAAFRARSFCQRQLANNCSDISEDALDLVADSLKKVQKMDHFEDYLHSAALKIQKRYRGWKERKDFLKIRNRIVKIQAHVRGHQVRKKYKIVVWSVGIVEKAILRWRRKSVGLRGFRVVQSAGTVSGEPEYEFLSIGRRQKSADVKKALDRVKSMVHNPEARDQYMRLVMKSQNFKVILLIFFSCFIFLFHKRYSFSQSDWSLKFYSLFWHTE
ncbi:hypothetical protein PIB30_028683 [Stylosanthes scabra]|uniref:CG-1 domain-containing protein n=1 Tax=Stylosanthes scabra TaxID=79078 RepID=A0ABU6TCW7_9FABA|nr:hypothetical protein [Stylosanthes scabra]